MCVFVAQTRPWEGPITPRSEVSQQQAGPGGAISVTRLFAVIGGSLTECSKPSARGDGVNFIKSSYFKNADLRTQEDWLQGVLARLALGCLHLITTYTNAPRQDAKYV